MEVGYKTLIRAYMELVEVYLSSSFSKCKIHFSTF
nr:MAG TPA: hypothetical protein [Caudoviricetes sp.]